MGFYLEWKILEAGALHVRCTVQTQLARFPSEFAAQQEVITHFLQRFLLFT